MKLSDNIVLITGGATGIGLAIAERFVRAGSEVIVCGRREDRLRAFAAKHTGVHARVCDLADEAAREALVQGVTRDFPRLNVLVNNAGVQRQARFSADTAPWASRREEIAINFEAPVHLAALLIPHLAALPRAAIVNVTSGLAFVPGVFAPVYCATKAALHSFSMSLRKDLEKTSIEVVEIIPPMVNTDLGGAGLHTQGVPVDPFADSVMERVAAGEQEVGYGFSETGRRSSREELDGAFRLLNQRFD